MSIEPTRHALNGPTKGTRWSALFFADPGFDPTPVQAALLAAADAWATVRMVKGIAAGADLARRAGLDALFLTRNDADGVQAIGFGRIFSDGTVTTAPAAGG